MFVWYAMEGLHNPLTLYFPWVAESSRQVRRIEKNSFRGLQVDPIPNSPNLNHEYFMADSREDHL